VIPFAPTSRLGALLLLGIPLLVVVNPRHAPAMALAFNGAILLIAFADFYISGRIQHFDVQRRLDEKLSLGASNRVEISVRSRCAIPLSIRVKDNPPYQFAHDGREIVLDLPPRARQTKAYHVIPPRRGDFSFGDLDIRCKSLFGLLERRMRQPAARRVKVYPSLINIRKYEIIALRRHSVEAGSKRVRQRGEGTEFESLRDYVPDDEFRRIDWKATARRSKPVSRQYQPERGQNVIVMLDAGRMMSAELEGMSKLDYAINATLMLGYAAVLRDDRVGLIVFSDVVKSYVAPAKGRPQLSKIMDELYAIEPELLEPDYGLAFRTLALRNKRRSLVIIFTDLIDVDASKTLLMYTSSLYPRHLPLCVTLQDSTLTAVAEQTPKQVADVFEKAVARKVLADRDEALLWLKRHGVLILDVLPTAVSVEVVNRYLALKARNII